MLAPLIGEMLGVEKTHITYSEDGRGHHVRIGDAIDVGSRTSWRWKARIRSS